MGGLQGCLRGVLPCGRQEAPRDLDTLLGEVARRSKGVLHIVSTAKSDKFSAPGLAKYLRMKGAEVYEGPASGDEALAINAERLLELLDRADNVVPPTSAPLRHLHAKRACCPEKLREAFPAMKEAYVQQPLDYGRNSRYGANWRISCYVVVMEKWKPKIFPHEPMVRVMTSVMDACCEAFREWFCRLKGLSSVEVRVMNAFVTRYEAGVLGEDQLEKHIDGANVDGSFILALPTDDPCEGGALHVWDGKPQKELVYSMVAGDMIFLDNAVWHQAKPITAGTRWALVGFLGLKERVPRAAGG